MGLSTLEKIGIGLAGAFVGSYFFPETFYGLSGGLLGNAPVAEASSIPAAGSISAADIANSHASFGGSALNDYVTGGVLSSGGSTAGAPSLSSSFVQGLTSPTGLAALLTAGSSLASGLLAADEAEENREFQSEEKERDREFSAGESEKSREFQEEQAALTRAHQEGLAEASREFQEEQSKKTRVFNALLGAQNRKAAAFSNRINAGRGSRQTAANVANLNQTLLA